MHKLEFLLKATVPILIICVALFNITMGWGERNLWVLLLFTCMAYLMPNPRFNNTIKSAEVVYANQSTNT